MAYSSSNAAWSSVNKTTKKAAKVAQEALGWMLPVGKPLKAVKAVKSISTAKKAKKVTRTLVSPKSNVTVKPAVKKTSSQSSTVKKVPRNTAPKTGLETRGTKPTTKERINRARDLQWDKAERSYEASNEISMTGLKSTNQGRVAARGAGKKNMRKRDAIRSEANKNLPIQINSARSFTSPSSGNMFRGTDILKANNTRALKAANRTRSGKSAKKK